MNKNPFAGARFLLSAADPVQLPRDEVREVAFCGRSNAGKSSALNLLCGAQAIARVSKTPGRTQLINAFGIEGLGRLMDLPGYGYAAVARSVRAGWGGMISGYLDNRLNLSGLVIIMDIRHPLMPLDRQMLDWSASRDLRTHILLTKADKLGYGAAKNTLQAVQKELKAAGLTSVQLFSATAKTGLDEARETITGLLKPQ